MSRRAADVVIVGGGIIGCSLAWELARRGAAVTVVERDRPGRGATWAAGGMLSPVAEAEGPGPFLEFALASLERYPEFVRAVREASGVPVEYRTEGKLRVALDEGQATELEAAYRWQRAAGHDVEWLDGDEARALEPALTDAVRAGILLAHDHWVDNRSLGEALWVAAARAGVRFVLGEPAVGIVRRSDGGSAGAGAVDGVVLAGGERLAAGRVVVAAGCWSGRLDGLPRPLPVVPVRGQMAAARLVPPALTRVVIAGHCYLIPRGDGRITIGATSERDGFRCDATPAGIASLLGAAMRVAPALANAPLEECWAGLRPGTPDDLPILGPDPEAPGLCYATGHFRNGILLAPITASLLADVVQGDGLPDGRRASWLDTFSPVRFTPEPAR